MTSEFISNMGDMAVGGLLAFVVSAVSGIFLLPVLRKLKIDQIEREEGPDSHKIKSGTPTMGGIMILLGFLVGCIPSLFTGTDTLPIIVLTLSFGVIGFIDDFIKVVLHRNKGLSAWQKLALQILFALAFAFLRMRGGELHTQMRIPFGGGNVINLSPIVAVIFLIFVAVATSNATNLTDGVDGLASSVTVVVAAFFAIYAAATGKIGGTAAMAMLGGLAGFLLYNGHPASVFMGDTGSLALGGFVTAMAYYLDLPLFIPIVGLIYVVEVLSVIIQVISYKLTGKRVFKMAPIHHHYEQSGWSETQVVTRFTMITLVLALVGAMALR